MVSNPSGAGEQRLTHQDASGRPAMVDVADKDVTDRTATAVGELRMQPATLAALRAGTTPKGDPLVVAQIAAIQAAKRTADLIPLCHPLALSNIDVRLEPDDSIPGVRVTATVRVRGSTGVEMEALTAVAVALLTAYDMLKAIEKGMQIGAIRLLSKSGGRSGDYHAR
ncbi:MAG: cyclic pyranopterin monophosphate synthase MoaC [Longimicrobiales bacterium]